MNIKLLVILLLVFGTVGGLYIYTNKDVNNIPNTSPQSDLFGPVEGIIPDEIDLINQHEIEKNQLENQQKLADEQIKLENIKKFNEVSDSGNIADCEAISDGIMKNECIDNGYAAKASIEGNKELCKNIKDVGFSVRCLDSFYYAEAIESKKSADCIKISNQQLSATCISNQILSKVEDPLYTGEVSICNALSGDQKDYCVDRIEKANDVKKIQVAFESNTISACNDIQDINMKNACYDTIYMKNAFAKEDISLCEKIDEASKKENCLESIGKIYDSKKFKEALEKNDVKICTQIKNVSEKAKCSDMVYIRVALANKDKSVCTKIVSPDLRNECTSLIQ